MTNPLLEQTGLPAFSIIKPEHVEPAIDHLLAENRRLIVELLDTVNEPTWHNLVEPLEAILPHLDRRGPTAITSMICFEDIR